MFTFWGVINVLWFSAFRWVLVFCDGSQGRLRKISQILWNLPITEKLYRFIDSSYTYKFLIGVEYLKFTHIVHYSAFLAIIRIFPKIYSDPHWRVNLNKPQFNILILIIKWLVFFLLMICFNSIDATAVTLTAASCCCCVCLCAFSPFSRFACLSFLLLSDLCSIKELISK